MARFIDYNQVLEVYLQNLSKMSPSYQDHFCLRMFRLTGEEKYLTILRQNFSKKIEPLLGKLGKIDQLPEKKYEKEQVRNTIRRNPVENKRVLRREAFYKKNYRFKQEMTAISLLNKLISLKMHQGKYKKRIQKILTEFKAYPWAKNFLKKEHLLINPVFFTNAVFYLKELKIMDGEKKLQTFVKQSFPPEKVQTKELLFDQVYTYTHLIINETSFYQKYLTPQQITKYRWLFTFFDQNFLTIYKKLNLDLILEILLCYRLAGQKAHFEKQAEAYLKTFFSKKEKILKADKEATIEDMEHANILLLMYLKLPPKFHTLRKSLL